MVAAFLLALSGLAHAPGATIAIDARRGTPISPYVYGVNYPDTWIYDWLAEWRAHGRGFTLAREGGNRFTAYNWETNASNAGADYFHENDDYLARSNEPGWSVRHFLRAVQDRGAAALLTVPTLGYVAADKRTDLYGDKDVRATPDYLNARFLRSYATKPGGRLAFPPDTTDRAVYQDEFVAWVQRAKSARTPVFFSLDNEPDLWSATHARIETAKTTYARILTNHIEYAAMIKRTAPGSLVFGPVNYGWGGMRDFQGAPDANGRDFTDTYLDAMREAERKERRRLVDVYDFHWYPESRGDGVRITFDDRPGTAATATARIQAPRSLWDPTFVEGTWITESLGNKAITMIPRLAAKIAAHYPGTRMAITEYDFGGRRSVSGMIAQADALGVFGRYGLFAACQWGLTHEDAAAFAGFRAFTDFDRQGARFGDRGLAVAGESPAENSVYAALDSKDPRRLTIVAINKTSAPQPLRLTIGGFRARSVRSFVVEEGAYDAPRPGDARTRAEGIELMVPPLAIVTSELRR